MGDKIPILETNPIDYLIRRQIMSSISKILRKEMEKSNGAVRLVEVPKKMKPTAESLEQLEREISVKIESNRRMRYRSEFESKD